MKTLNIHSELQTLLPALSEKEYAGLEKDILERGCLSPIVTWNDTIVDGHNRYAICQRHGILFEVKQLEFETLDDAMFWAWTHQENRRNLTQYQRGELALKFKAKIAAKAYENKIASGGNKKNKAGSVLPNSANPIQPINTRKALAEIANVAPDTISRIEFLNEHADDETKQKLRQGKTSINKEYMRAKEKAADSKPKTTRTKKAKEASPATEQETPKTPASNNIPCINELANVKRTTLKDIRHDDPDYLLCNLATHFRKGYIKDLILKGMKFLHEKEGEKTTTPIAKEITKLYLKTKR